MSFAVPVPVVEAGFGLAEGVVAGLGIGTADEVVATAGSEVISSALSGGPLAAITADVLGGGIDAVGGVISRSPAVLSGIADVGGELMEYGPVRDAVYRRFTRGVANAAEAYGDRAMQSFADFIGEDVSTLWDYVDSGEQFGDIVQAAGYAAPGAAYAGVVAGGLSGVGRFSGYGNRSAEEIADLPSYGRLPEMSGGPPGDDGNRAPFRFNAGRTPEESVDLPLFGIDTPSGVVGTAVGGGTVSGSVGNRGRVPTRNVPSGTRVSVGRSRRRSEVDDVDDDVYRRRHKRVRRGALIVVASRVR